MTSTSRILITCSVVLFVACGENEADRQSRKELASSIRQVNMICREFDEYRNDEGNMRQHEMSAYHDELRSRFRSLRRQLHAKSITSKFQPSVARLDSVLTYWAGYMDKREELFGYLISAVSNAQVVSAADLDIALNPSSGIDRMFEAHSAFVEDSTRAVATLPAFRRYRDSALGEEVRANETFRFVGIPDTLSCRPHVMDSTSLVYRLKARVSTSNVTGTFQEIKATLR